jgi:NDP-sugar pyrophosphorylase family protein
MFLFLWQEQVVDLQMLDTHFPKPLIEVDGKPMIQVVVENLNIEANYTFIVQKEHYEKYSLQYLLNLIAPNCNIVQVDGLTEGAACTTLLAKEFINNDAPLVMANSDQFVEWNSNECLYAFNADGIDGGIVSFKATHPKWSYAKVVKMDLYLRLLRRNQLVIMQQLVSIFGRKVLIM